MGRRLSVGAREESKAGKKEGRGKMFQHQQRGEMSHRKERGGGLDWSRMPYGRLENFKNPQAS